MSKALLTIITIIKESLKSSYGWYISLLIYSLILWILALIIEPIIRFYIRKHKSGNLYLNNETKCKLQDIQDLRKPMLCCLKTVHVFATSRVLSNFQG